jgi:hypothetical protein
MSETGNMFLACFLLQFLACLMIIHWICGLWVAVCTSFIQERFFFQVLQTMTCYAFTWNWRAISQRRCFGRQVFDMFIRDVAPNFLLRILNPFLMWFSNMTSCFGLLSCLEFFLVQDIIAEVFIRIYVPNLYLFMLLYVSDIFCVGFLLAGSIYWSEFWSGLEFSCYRRGSCHKKGLHCISNMYLSYFFDK